MRFAVCLLAALQGIAVSWHVCELGGNPHATVCHSHLTAAPQQCHAPDDPTRVWRMAVGETPSPDKAPNCLAALLGATPGQISQPVTVNDEFVSWPTTERRPLTAISRYAPFSVDARGPPTFS